MTSNKFIGLLVLCLFIYVTECGRFSGRSGGRSSSRGGSSWGKSWGGSSSSGSSWSKPSSSWGSSGSSYKPSSSWNTGSSSSSGSHRYPSSTGTGLSGSSSWSKPSSSSSGSHGYPSSTGLSGSGSSWSKPSSSNSGSYGYPSSGGLSGSGSSWSKPSSSNSGSYGYPSSTGLSGSGSSWSKPSSSNSGSSGYPSSTGLSGSGSSWSKPSSSNSGSSGYPSSTGLSGSGSSWSKPSSSSSGSHGYPSSSTGLSGSGSGSSSRYPSSSGTHSYPSGSGLSGSGSSTHHNPSYGNSNYNRPKNTYNTNSGYNPGYNTGYHGSYQTHYIPTYYTAPQHVYVTQYRDSGSRYSDLLTGLTLYNMGRSHSHYHDHYYVDDYHRNRYQSTGGYNNQQQSSYDKPNSEAVCSLRINENGRLQVLKIPCEIVSTFTEGSNKVESETRLNQTVCTTNLTVTKTTPYTNASVTTELPATTNSTVTNTTLYTNAFITTELPATTASPVPTVNVTESSSIKPIENRTEAIVLEATTTATTVITRDTALQNVTASSNVTMTTENPVNVTANVSSSDTIGNSSSTLAPNVMVIKAPIIKQQTSNKTDGNVFTQTVTVQTTRETIVNVTVCTTTQGYTDPLTVKGGPINDGSIKECSVDIKTKDAHFRNTIDCKTLMEYSRMPPPVKEQKPLLPPREKLKSWLEKPPWWMSMFIAV